MKTYRLERYNIKQMPNGYVGISWFGEELYADVIRDAFPQHQFSDIVEMNREYDYAFAIISPLSDDEYNQICIFIEFLSRMVYLDIGLKQAFAIGYHYQDGKPTNMQDLVYYTKYYPRQEKAQMLMEYYYKFFYRHPSYQKSDFIIPMPSSRPDSNNTPRDVVRYIHKYMGIPDGTHLVRKTRLTPPMKNIHTYEDKKNTIYGAFEVTVDSLVGKHVTIIDDICQSGTTLIELARVLKDKGAIVQALVATKTQSDV
ncbi:MAG: hypothetical protein SFZ02_14785 [bacterium]|nr:hypothetical protein [bacterium]